MTTERTIALSSATHAPTPVAAHRSHPWIIFALAGLAQFMVVLDSAVMNVALAAIQRGLHFSQADSE
jgi:hypothetical protein